MKSWEEVAIFCKSTILPSLGELEDKRCSSIRLFLIIAAAEAVFTVFLFILFFPHHDPDPLTNGCMVFFYSLLFIFIYMVALLIPNLACRGNMHNDYVLLVLSQMIPLINPELKFDQSGFVSKDIFMKSQMFGVPDEYDGSNHVTGMCRGINICFSRVRARWGQGRSMTWREGVFFYADFPKKSTTAVLVYPSSGLQDIIRPQVVMDDPEFNKEFEVRGQDKIQIMSVLSLSLMQRLVAFKRRNNKLIQLSFVDGKVYVFMESELGNPVAGLLWRSLLSMERIKIFYDQICMYLDIVDLLKLNEI